MKGEGGPAVRHCADRNILPVSRNDCRRTKCGTNFEGAGRPNQCCGSVTFWYGSGTTAPYHWITDPDVAPDPDPVLFISGFEDVKKISFFVFYFLKVHLRQSLKIKSHIEVTKQWFFYFYLLDDGRLRFQCGLADPRPNSESRTGGYCRLWPSVVDCSLSPSQD